jgi:hypothetical protein
MPQTIIPSGEKRESARKKSSIFISNGTTKEEHLEEMDFARQWLKQLAPRPPCFILPAHG